MKEMTEEAFEILEQEIWREYLEQATPAQIHHSVISANWDSNGFLLNWLKDNPETDKGTILMAYWKSGPRLMKNFVNREQVLQESSWSIDSFDVIEDIEAKYCQDFYKNEDIFFNPTQDSDGYDWTADYLDEVVVREIPKPMFKPTKGKSIPDCSDNFVEGLPIKPINYFQKVEDILDEYDII